MNKQLLSGDYKKWLLYSFDKQGFDSHYNLFKALEAVASVGTVNISKSGDSEGLQYMVMVDSVDDRLQLTEPQRLEFLRYLKDTYFQTDDIDELMIEKSRKSDVSKNHHYDEPDDRHDADAAAFKVQQHPKEITYFNIKLIVSILVYTLILGAVVYGALYDLSIVFSVAIMIPVLLLFVLFSKILKGLFIGMVRGESIRITKDQFPDIYSIIQQQARMLNLEVPEIYITSGHFNAFVTTFSRRHVLMIYSEVVETTLRGNFDVLKYVTAHELCHIKQKHLKKDKYLLPSRIIPFLSLAYSRGCEYTCDRVGYHFSPKGSIEGVLIMTTGKEIYSKFNIDLHIKNSMETDGFWTWLSEKFLTHPHLYKRMIEIKEYSKYN